MFTLVGPALRQRPGRSYQPFFTSYHERGADATIVLAATPVGSFPHGSFGRKPDRQLRSRGRAWLAGGPIESSIRRRRRRLGTRLDRSRRRRI